MKDCPIIIIAGPTAAGKTEIAMRIAEHFRTEIISADSMQVYRHLNIGTAKPTLIEQRRVPHHLIDLVEPDQPFTVADYQSCFHSKLQEFAVRKLLPLIVGGTGLYIRASLQSFQFGPASPETALRQELHALAAQFGNEYLYHQLLEQDPVSAARIHPNDLRRVIRAIEVFRITGVRLSEQPRQSLSLQRPIIYLVIDRDRTELYQRINVRVDRMIADGLLDEVRQLLQLGFGPELKSLQGLGYRQMTAFLHDEIFWDDALVDLKQASRNYAKRQLTWFRREPFDSWWNLSNQGPEYIDEILSFIEGRLDQTSNKNVREIKMEGERDS
jgi:tRNA dimethylallyltransferase